MLLLTIAACSWFRPAYDGPSNILVVLIDDIGVDKVGVYGADYAAHTPTLDSLAAEGLRFDNAYGAPLCSPARSLLLTGRHARRTGIGTITERDSNASQLSTDAVTVPEVLRHASNGPWQDGAVGKWHLAGRLAEDWPTHPLRSGFQWFAGVRGNPEYREGRKYDRWTRNLNGQLADDDRYLTVGTTDDALLRIGQMQEPWFLYVAYNAAHVPIHDPPAELRPAAVPAPRTALQQHDAMIAVLDREIGRLLDGIDPWVRSHTTVVVMGDNGTSRFGLHPGDGPGHRRIKHSVYQGGTRIPMIVTGPLVAHPGTRTSALVHLTDLLPTVAELAGVPVRDGVLELPDQRVALDGRSLVPLLRGETDAVHETVYTEAFEPNGPGPYRKDRQAVRDATHTYLRHHGREELYRLQPGTWWEHGPNLLREGAVREKPDEEALVRLRARMDAYEAELVYEGR